MQRPLQDDGRVHGVIVGCRRDDGRWLLIRRSAHVIAPLQIAFPGGAVEVGEDREAAAKREVHEEVGLRVTTIQHVWTHIFDDKPLTLFGYLASGFTGQIAPDPGEVAETLWLTTAELAGLDDALPRSHDFAATLDTAVLRQA